MKLSALELPDVFLLEPELQTDSRGSFGRLYCRERFLELGLDPAISQCNISHNRLAGTLRGMHFQESPHAEIKLVRCQAGASFHVIIDLRQDSPAYCRWTGVELSPDSHRSLYVPEGCAHGFLTLEPNTTIHYQMSSPYVPESARGVKWDDPAFGIEWPIAVETVSDRDRAFAPFERRHHASRD